MVAPEDGAKRQQDGKHRQEHSERPVPLERKERLHRRDGDVRAGKCGAARGAALEHSQGECAEQSVRDRRRGRPQVRVPGIGTLFAHA